ncbi:MAG: electron transfer flavoprotein subunit beta/FixA family protein [Prevotella sp.]|nr:electron transfer flavoprotein subunit beta/FixA family protein [Prevotella sp.]
MSLKIVVLAKQVPDTRNVGPDAMTPEGTVNRAALPAVFNPDDLNALEMALRLKEQFAGSTVSVVTMGLPKSADIIREALYRGADEGYVITDRPLGGADTLATSYTLAQAVKKLGTYDIILCGRQAIDGDTAQVGPQVAEKLGLTQVTYAEEILSLDKEAGRTVIRRHIDGGVETVEAPLPVVVTVNGSAAACRPRNAKRVMKYKNATAPTERTAEQQETLKDTLAKKPYLNINQWGAQDIDADPAQIGKAGSPTNVKTVRNIVFKAKESKTLTGSDADVENVIIELLNEKIIG